MTVTDAKIIPPETTATQRKSRASTLNFILLLLLLALTAWLAHAWVNQPPAAAAKPHEADAKLALMEDRLRALQDKMQPLEERIGILEAQATAQEKIITELGSRPATVNSPAGEALSRGVIAALESRVSELDRRISGLPTEAATAGAPPEHLQSLEARIAQLEAQNMQAGGAESKRLAKLHAFYLLQSAIFEGKPYSAEYIGLSDMVGEQSDISDAMDLLNSYAEEGIPSQQALMKQFMDLARQSLNLPLPDDAPFFDRLGHNISSLVTIRKVGDHQKGLEKQAILARAEAHLARGELEAAVAEVQSMNVSDQAVFGDWLEDAKVRLYIPATLSQIQESLLRSAGDAAAGGANE